MEMGNDGMTESRNYGKTESRNNGKWESKKEGGAGIPARVSHRQECLCHLTGRANSFRHSVIPSFRYSVIPLFRNSVILSLLLCPLLCMAAPAVLRLPVNAEVVSEDLSGSTWRQNARIGVSYVGAINQLRAVFGQQGWAFRRRQDLGSLNDKCLLVFVKGKTELTVMVWKVGVSETGFSWGMSDRN